MFLECPIGKFTVSLMFRAKTGYGVCNPGLRDALNGICCWHGNGRTCYLFSHGLYTCVKIIHCDGNSGCIGVLQGKVLFGSRLIIAVNRFENAVLN